VICWPVRVSLFVMPVGSAYDTRRSPFVNVSPLWVQVPVVAKYGDTLASMFIEARTSVFTLSFRSRSFVAFVCPLERS
jgi:hypothetical protein